MLSTLITSLIALHIQGAPATAKKPTTPAVAHHHAKARAKKHKAVVAAKVVTPVPVKDPSGLSPRPTPEKVLVTVNGVPIKAAAVEPYLWDWKSEEVIDNLVNFELVNIEAKRLHIGVTPAEITKTLDDELDQFRKSLPPGADVYATLRSKGYPKSRIELTIKSSVLLDKIALLDFKPSDFVNVSTIIVKPKTQGPDDVAAAQKTCQAYYDQLVKGDQWVNVLAASTTDANVTKNHGLIGWRALGAFPPNSVAEVAKLKVGAFTHPITTQYGVQIFRLESNGLTAQPSELASLKVEFAQNHRNDVLTKLRSAAKIVKTQ